MDQPNMNPQQPAQPTGTPANQPSPSTQPTQSGQKNTAMGIIAYIVFFVPLLTSSKNDPFVKYHVKQGLVLFIAGVGSSIILRILDAILFAMPYYSWSLIGIVSLLNTLLSLAVLVLFIIGVINVVNGKEQPLPVIGKYADKFKF